MVKGFNGGVCCDFCEPLTCNYVGIDALVVFADHPLNSGGHLILAHC